MPEAAKRLLVAGLTTRPLALSAARAGWRVSAVDGFGDLDLRAQVDIIPFRRVNGGFDSAAAVAAAQNQSADAVAYTSNFENHPSAVTALAAGRRLLGNPAAVLERVRDPVRLMLALQQSGFRAPATRARAPRLGTADARWLLKPRRSGGGHGIMAWSPGVAVRREQYLQQRIGGIPGSVSFLSDGRSAVTLGLSRQIVGRREFGTSGFRYCGSLTGTGLFEQQDRVREAASALADAVTREFGLVGLNGIDFIARDGVPWPIEVNPRYSASMELLERNTELSLFSLHAEACAGRLPAWAGGERRGVSGKAVVFARKDVTMGATRSWVGNPSIADVPGEGERIARGRPICTVFASGRSPADCLQALSARAAAIYHAVEPRRGAA